MTDSRGFISKTKKMPQFQTRASAQNNYQQTDDWVTKDFFVECTTIFEIEGADLYFSLSQHRLWHHMDEQSLR